MRRIIALFAAVIAAVALSCGGKEIYHTEFGYYGYSYDPPMQIGTLCTYIVGDSLNSGPYRVVQDQQCESSLSY